MKLTKCENSHYYDSDKYPECPYCNTSLQQGSNIVTAAGAQAGAAAVQAVQTAQPTGPVTGWLVVMNGKARGRDLRLGEGRSFIGLDAAGAPVLLSADSPLSARQAVVVYDPATSAFTLLPGTSKELCYLAGAAVLVPQPLAAGDELTLGAAVLCFVPFCGEFKWEPPVVAAEKPAEKAPEKAAEKSAAKPKNTRTTAARSAAAKREAAKPKSKRAAKAAEPATTAAEPEEPATPPEQLDTKPESKPEANSENKAAAVAAAPEEKKPTTAEK